MKVLCIPEEDMAPRHITYRLSVGITVIEDHDTGDECDHRYRCKVLLIPPHPRVYEDL